MTIETIELELRDALVHLYDPDFVPSQDLYALTGRDASDGAVGVQTAIIETINSMKPAPDLPASARIRKVHDLLRNRFVLKLTLEETAERMDMSFSSTWRAQRAAVHSLTQVLWSLRTQGMSGSSRSDGDGDHQPSVVAIPGAQAVDWRSQMQRELDSLRACAPDRVADVGEVVAGVLDLAEALAPGSGFQVEVKHIQPGLVAAVHPAVLRQAMIAAVRRMTGAGAAETISLFAGLEEGNVKITITGRVAEATQFPEADLVDDIPVPEGMSVWATVERSQAFLWIEAPSVGKTTVLVVDDNPDMARFYRRATEGTCYHIVHIDRGQQLNDAVERACPDLVVLDVMLPDIDGWQLLMRLHENPDTRSTPIVVCTVVREQELALSLGAAAFLTKPVRPQEFIEALDGALPPAPSAGRTSA